LSLSWPQAWHIPRKNKLKKYIDKKEESIDLAERGLSFRKVKEY